MKRFIIHTFGCQMNVCDSERISDILCDSGWEYASFDDDADLVIFNTCCVRESAEERALGRLTLMKPWRRAKACRILALCGCIAQKEGDKLLSRFPFLDLVVGTRDFHLFPKLLDDVIAQKRPRSFTNRIEQPLSEIDSPRRSGDLSAFVNIIYGCDNFCSYCIVPFVRGREVSRYSGDIRREVESLIRSGVKEVCLLGQNVNSYKDAATGADFPDLLRIIDSIPGIERIRFTTSHPKDASLKLIHAVRDLPHVCEQFHLPVQSGSDAILKAMNRRYSRGDYLKLVDRIRRNIPDAVITTDLLVGFPGETDQDFQDTVDLCQKARWDAAFMFMYSPRKGTSALSLGDDVPLDLKKKRLAELIRIQENISREKNRALEGKTVEVLVERRAPRNPDQLSGKDRGGRTVVFPGKDQLRGRIVQVMINKTTAHTLIGTRLDFVTKPS
ncbi:tRNA (N6-isopentenyl adenosine(37)-C2)-methylthiotransferase MiaB [Candidatus Sumerlaeota bacterium]|nr:tRNA (N6-isopentenyl adenosine(37)-C2)-methylthiotransferase MiaB [Candidatus Sumerlaeota bacterium]